MYHVCAYFTTSVLGYTSPMRTTLLHDKDLNKALRLADTADDITLRYYLSANLQIDTKPDTSPVTQADKACEQALRQIVEKDFGDAYIGEEGARVTSDNLRSWVVDPIDGTKNYLRGMPVWGTLISLSDREGLLVSVVSAPAMGRRWWAVRGKGAFTSDAHGQIRQLHVSKVGRIEDAFLSYASLFSWDKVPAGSDRVLMLLKTAWRNRAIGDFLNYMLVAEGAIDACFEPDPKQWDLDAPALIIQEAGGSIWTDAAASTPPEAPRIVIGSNGLLEEAIKAKLGLETSKILS